MNLLFFFRGFNLNLFFFFFYFFGCCLQINLLTIPPKCMVIYYLGIPSLQNTHWILMSTRMVAMVKLFKHCIQRILREQFVKNSFLKKKNKRKKIKLKVQFKILHKTITVFFVCFFFSNSSCFSFQFCQSI